MRKLSQTYDTSSILFVKKFKDKVQKFVINIGHRRCRYWKGIIIYRFAYNFSFIFCFQTNLNLEVFQLDSDNNFHKTENESNT